MFLKIFFDTYGLILYYQMEPSGSNKVNVKSLTLQKDYSLIINVEHYFPAVGTCDIAGGGGGGGGGGGTFIPY